MRTVRGAGEHRSIPRRDRHRPPNHPLRGGVHIMRNGVPMPGPTGLGRSRPHRRVTGRLITPRTRRTRTVPGRQHRLTVTRLFGRLLGRLLRGRRARGERVSEPATALQADHHTRAQRRHREALTGRQRGQRPVRTVRGAGEHRSIPRRDRHRPPNHPLRGGVHIMRNGVPVPGPTGLGRSRPHRRVTGRSDHPTDTAHPYSSRSPTPTHRHQALAPRSLLVGGVPGVSV